MNPPTDRTGRLCRSLIGGDEKESLPPIRTGVVYPSLTLLTVYRPLALRSYTDMF